MISQKPSRFKDESKPTKVLVLFSFPFQPSVRSRRLEHTGINWAQERTGRARETRKGRGIIGLRARTISLDLSGRRSLSPRISPSHIPFFLGPLNSKRLLRRLSRASSPGPGCSKLGYDNPGLVRNLNSDMKA